MMGNVNLRMRCCILLPLLFTCSAICAQKVGKKNNAVVRIGKLPNGLTYYIHKLPAEKNKVSLRLIVKAGNAHELQDQLELSHLLEHMAFVKTKHFPDVKAWLDKEGIVFGRDSRANTGMDMTNYRLNISTDKPERMLSSLQWLRDIAQGGIVFDIAKINNERGVVMTETIGNFFSFQMSQKYAPAIYGNSHFTRRDIADVRKNLMSFRPSSLVSFYADWYRPQHQAIVVVGDIDPDHVLQQVRKMFGDLIPGGPKQLKTNTAKLDGKSRVVIATHPQQQNVDFKVILKRPQFFIRNAEDYRQLFLQRICDGIMKARFEETRKNETGQASVSLTFRSFGNAGNPFWARVIEGNTALQNLQQSLVTVLKEIERAKLFGFSAEELLRAKTELKHLSPEINAGILADEYMDQFREGTWVPPVPDRAKFLDSVTNSISLSEVNDEIKRWHFEKNRDLLLLAPEADQRLLPDETTFINWMSNIDKKSLTAFVYGEETVPATPLMQPTDIAAIIGSDPIEAKSAGAGITKWVYPNGVTVWLKPLPDSADGIRISGIHKVGLSQYSGQDLTDATLLSAVLREYGLGPFDGPTLKRYMQSKGASVWSIIDENETGVYARAKEPQHLETALQAMYLFFTTNRKLSNQILEKVVAEKQQEIVRKSPASLAIQQHNLIEELVSVSKLPKVFSYSSAAVQPSNLNRLFRELILESWGRHFIVTGPFEPEQLKPLISKYLGAIPLEGKGKLYTSMPGKLRKKLDTTLYTGTVGEKADVRFYFNVSKRYTIPRYIESKLLEKILDILFMERLRRKEGVAYTPYNISIFNDLNVDQFSYIMSFDCSASDVSKGSEAWMDEIRLLQTKGPDHELLQKAKELVRAHLDKEISSNAMFWQSYIARLASRGEDMSWISNYAALLENITTEQIRNMAMELTEGGNYIHIVTLPGNPPMSNWFPGDLKTDSVYGISLRQAYASVFAKKPEPVVVAVLDNGLDTSCNVIKPMLWSNVKEKGNDEDLNGYRGDLHGWNFLGSSNGKNLYKAGYEYQRAYFELLDGKGDESIRHNVVNRMRNDSAQRVNTILEYLHSIKKADSIIRQSLNKNGYLAEDLTSLNVKDKTLQHAVYKMSPLFQQHQGLTNSQIISKWHQILDSIRNNPYENPIIFRTKIIGDNYRDITDTKYGNSDVTAGMSSVHGTCVATTISCMISDAVAPYLLSNSIRVMALRAVPKEGDEYDKDVALAIRYAVDNGAKIINMSFSKSLSPGRHFVEEAIRYAAEKDVLIVKGAGNDTMDIDRNIVYPSPIYKNGERAMNMIVVGANGRTIDSLVAPFSNFGKNNVDVFAPGVNIQSFGPGDFPSVTSGTSMAAPIVSGVAALIRSYFPKLKATEVKKIIEQSVLKIPNLAVLCRSGGIVNAYQAVILASTFKP